MNLQMRTRLKAIRLDRNAIRITALYWLIGGLWILFSDQFAEALASDKYTLTTISIYKGWFYFLVTGLLLYWLIRRNNFRLQKSTETYQFLAENISDVIWILDLETSRFLYVSPSVERLRGYTAEEVIKQDMSSALTPEFMHYLEQICPND